MFYDLNVPYSSSDAHLPRTLAFLQELGYDVVALNHTIEGKLPAQITSAISSPLPSTLTDAAPRLRILRRCTLTLLPGVSYPNARLAELARNYDLLALRPTDEKSLQLACASLDCEIISLDLGVRWPFYFRMKMLAEAVRAGKKFEICYSQALGLGAGGGGGAGAAERRRLFVQNASQLVRATRGGRGVLISSEARAAVACRAPWDVINLAEVTWGLGRERAVEALESVARWVVVTAEVKRRGWRGVVDVVWGGEDKQAREEHSGGEGKGAGVGKRKAADALVEEGGESGQALSKTQMKKRARLEAAAATAKAKLLEP